MSAESKKESTSLYQKKRNSQMMEIISAATTDLCIYIKHVCLISTRQEQEEEKNSAIADEASRRSSVPAPPPNTHTHTHTQSLSGSVSLCVQALLIVENARSGMPIYKVPSSHQSGAPDLDNKVCIHSTLFVPNRVFPTS
jgi:hypothetical protein